MLPYFIGIAPIVLVERIIWNSFCTFVDNKYDQFVDFQTGRCFHTGFFMFI
jgi:hypothetical protein